MTSDCRIAIWEALALLLRSNLPLAETEKWAELPAVREVLREQSAQREADPFNR